MRARAILALLALAVAAACEADDAAAPQPPPPTTSTTAAPAALAIGQQALTGPGNRVTVREWDPGPVPAGLVRSPPPGHRYAAVSVEGCAGEPGVRLRPTQFSLELADGTRWQSTVPARRPRLEEDKVLGRDECAAGWVTFEIPDAADVRLVLFESEPRDLAWLV
ncbi:MAG TPA: hypothetical protein VM030_00615 [Acidimicrobiales bacterium]|nr:hypothetical protein [Acidimicrobiales bacterium]